MQPYYSHAGITIFNCDNRDVLPTLEAGTVDLVLTDPPYGINYESGSTGVSWWHGRAIANDEGTRVRDEVLAWWSPRPALVFGSRKQVLPVGTRQVLIWDKGPALGMGALDLPWKASYEEIYVLGRGFKGSRDSGSVLRFSPVQSMAANGRVHPNQKPIDLILHLMNRSPDGTVLDPFLGSGTTLVAAKMLGRRAIGIEIEERYCEIAAKRLQQEVLPLGGDVPIPESQLTLAV